MKKELIEILNYVKCSYKDQSIRDQIDEAIELLNGKEGVCSEKVLNILQTLKVAYDDPEMIKVLDYGIDTLR